MVDDVESDWLYEDTPFDLVHARYLAESIRDMPRLVQQAYKYVCLRCLVRTLID